MADDTEDGAASAAAADSAAMHAALGTAGASTEARDYLRKQSVLADLQIENLRKLEEYETSHLRWRRFNDQMRGLLQIMAAAVGALIVIGIAAALWSAREDRSLVVEAFAVPPDFAAKGLTGDVVANQILGKLATMQSQTASSRPAGTYTNNWGGDIKVQIPDTGVSIGDAYRLLASWLGHQTRISGEIWHTPKGLAVAARAGDDGATFTGSEDDLDALEQKAAEAVYARTQPYRYVAYLTQVGRDKEGMAAAIALAENSKADRAWADALLANEYQVADNMAEALSRGHAAVAADPANALAWSNLNNVESSLDHEEAALADQRGELAALAHDNGEMREDGAAVETPLMRASIAEFLGDYQTAVRENRDAARAPNFNGQASLASAQLISDHALLHDAKASDEARARAPRKDFQTALSYDFLSAAADDALERWSGVVRDMDAMRAMLDKIPPAFRPGVLDLFSRSPSVLKGIALAHLGDLKGAHALLDASPADCDNCILGRARLAVFERKWGRADYWFARGEASTPSLPFPDEQWGLGLLAKGDADGAIAKFASAHKKAPNYADPLEGWGEALIAKNRSDLALAKFEAAARDAPNWGRLHLKWGEALMWSGKRDEAKKQFAAALGLDLAPDEKSELTRIAHG